MRNFVLSVSVLVLLACSAQADVTFEYSTTVPVGFDPSKSINRVSLEHNGTWHRGDGNAMEQPEPGDYAEAPPVFDQLGGDGLFYAALADLGIAKLDFIRVRSGNYVDNSNYAMIDQLYVSDTLAGVENGSPLFNYNPAETGWVNDAYIKVTDPDSLLSSIFIRVSDAIVGGPGDPYDYTISFYGTAVTPEPATMLIFGVGLAGAGVAALRRRKK